MSLTSYRAAPPRANISGQRRTAARELLLLPVPQERNGGGLLHPAPPVRRLRALKISRRGVAPDSGSQQGEWVLDFKRRLQSLATTYSSTA